VLAAALAAVPLAAPASAATAPTLPLVGAPARGSASDPAVVAVPAVAPAAAGPLALLGPTPALRAAVEPPGAADATGGVPLDGDERSRADRLRGVARDLLGDRPRADDRDGGGSPSIPDDGGGPSWLLRALLVLLIGVAVVGVVAAVLARRRRPAARARPGGAPLAGGPSVEELERRAQEAEARGDHRAAVVLRFRAGVRRLRERGRLPAAAAATSGTVAAATGDPRVAALARDHDRAAYGADEVGSELSRRAREGWTAVLAGGREREDG